jgi:hypothetical protein
LFLEALEDRSVPATISWVNPAGGDWDTPSNWSSGAVPGAGDDVVISSLSSSSSITRASGAAITVQNLTFSGGTLAGTEQITVAGTFTWTGGVFSGGGSLTAAGGAALSGSTALSGYTLVIPPGQSATQEDITELKDGSVLDNQGTLTLTGTGDFGYGALGYDGSAALLRNEGTIHTNQDSLLFVPIDSPGDIVVDNGSLNLGYSQNSPPSSSTTTISGRIDATHAAVLQFRGQTTLAPTSSVDATTVSFFGPTQVAGSYSATYTAVNGGPVTVTGTVTALGGLSISQNNILDLTAATLAPGNTDLSSLTVGISAHLLAAADWTVSGPVSLMGFLDAAGGRGSLTAAGSADLSGFVVALSGYTLIIPPGQSATLYARTDLLHGSVLDNQGTLTLSGTGYFDSGLVEGAAPALLHNEGVIHTNQNSLLSVPIDGPGDIIVDNGKLSLASIGTFGGRIDATNAAGLVFLGQTTLAPTSSVDATTVSFYGPTQVAGSYSATFTAVNGGPVTFTGTVRALGGLSISQNNILDLTAATLPPGNIDLSSLTVGISAHLLAAADWTVSGPVSLMGFVDAAGGRGSLTAAGGADLSGFVVALSGYTLIIPSGQSATLEARTDLKDGSVLDNQGTLTLNGTGYFDTGLVQYNGGDGGAPALLKNEGVIHTNQNSSLALAIDSPGDIVVDNGSLSLGYSSLSCTTVSTFSGRIDATNATGLQLNGQVTLAATSSVDAASLTLAESSLDLQLGGTTPGAGFDQIQVGSSVTLGGQLQLDLVNGFTPYLGEKFTIINNNGTAPVAGSFSNLVSPPGYQLHISYADGNNHNDVTLTVVHVPNTPPTNVTPSLSATTINEGQSATLGVSFTDPDALDTHTVVVSWGESSANTTVNLGPGVCTLAGLSHTYQDNLPANAPYTITATVTDSFGASASGATSITVQNVSPAVGTITAPTAPSPVNTVITASAAFTDPRVLDTHTALWSWGDGNTSAGAVTESNGSGSVTGSHAYAVDGVYTVTLTVTDKDGASGLSSFSYVVVYNPSAGFTTGGGWFNSPAGADAANPALTGKASFGFNAKYQSGATVPTGNTEFKFPAAGLNFHGTSYDWLVITTNQAQYQGSGTINGAGNYGFLVTAQDNGGTTPDLIRMKIWDKNNNNAVVYDTQPGAPTTAAPTTALGGGRIQVHTNAQLVAGAASTGTTNLAPLTLAELQPIVREAIARWGAAGVAPARLRAVSQITVGIADFPGPWLGMAFPGVIWIDQNAAGYGWYIDPTPADDAEFPATPGSPAYGKVDLLTVVTHELGHELGFDDTAGNSLMGVFLTPGTRRIPAPAHPEAGSGSTLIPAALVSVAGTLAPAGAGTSRPAAFPWDNGQPNPVPLGSEGTLPAFGGEAANAGGLKSANMQTSNTGPKDGTSTNSLDWYFARLAQDLVSKKSNGEVFPGIW